MKKAVQNSDLTPQEKSSVLAWLDGDRTDWSGMRMVGAIASMGDLFATTPKEKNEWKVRMLKAGLKNQGLDIPEGFEKLPQRVQTKRLNLVTDTLLNVGKENKKKKKHWVHKETEVWN
jgi:hypothetical protein